MLSTTSSLLLGIVFFFFSLSSFGRLGGARREEVFEGWCFQWCFYATHRLQCDQSFVCCAQGEVLPQAIDGSQPQHQPDREASPAGLGEVALRAHLLCTMA